MNQCLDENAIVQFATGRLAPSIRAQATLHLSSCASCRRLIALAASGSASLTATPENRARETLAPVDAERYELRGEIARGGMGAIFEAWDKNLGRTVAIKRLFAASPAAARRFVREALIGARLQHPAIIPVYEAGRWQDGEPFLAMKLVRGRSLEAALAQKPELVARLALLPHLIAAADALAYAHAQGVVHRDLKPGNLLIGEYGETVVIDWGLAKAMEPAEQPAAPAVEAALPDEAALSVTGALLGTPIYMPPEQARGEPVDARADVYSLGAILYEVLAGHRPYREATNAAQAVTLVRQGPPQALSDCAPEVPPDLIAIVDRAMRRSPEQRYPTAGELAADLRSFAAGRLVSAHSYSAGQLARRFVGRHRAPFAVGAAALLALGALGGFSFRRIARERRTALIQRDAAEGLTGFMVVELRKQLAAVGKLELLGGLGARVDDYYRALSALDDANGPEALARRASALETLADVASAKNDHGAARGRSLEAIALRERAAGLSPLDREQRARLAEAVLRLSDAEAQLGNNDRALAESQRAARLIAALVAEEPQSTRAQRLLARSRSELAALLAEHSDTAGALEARRSERDILSRLAAANPADAELQYDLAQAFLYLGQLEVMLSRYRDALATEKQASAVFDGLVAREPDNVRWQLAQSNAVQMTAAVYGLLGEPQLAIPLWQRCVATRERLLKLEPQSVKFQRTLAYCLEGQIKIYRDLHQPAEAKAVAMRALALKQAAATAHPESTDTRRDVVITLRDLAQLALDAGLADDALAWAEQSDSTLDELERREPGRINWVWLRAEVKIIAAKAALQARGLDAALASAQAAVSAAEQMASKGPGDPTALELRAAARASLAEVLLARREAAGAKAAAVAAVADFDELWRREADHTSWLDRAPAAARTFASACARTGDAAAARERLERTLGALEQLRTAGKLPSTRLAVADDVRGDLSALGR